MHVRAPLSHLYPPNSFVRSLVCSVVYSHDSILLVFECGMGVMCVYVKFKCFVLMQYQSYNDFPPLHKYADKHHCIGFFPLACSTCWNYFNISNMSKKISRELLTLNFSTNQTKNIYIYCKSFFAMLDYLLYEFRRVTKIFLLYPFVWHPIKLS